jgi:two-component system, OmpR family, sensor histidine kinase BaeS
MPPACQDFLRLNDCSQPDRQCAASHPTGGTVTVQARADVKQPSSLQLEVVDTGEGIAPEHLPFVFERFYRANTSRTRATGGADLCFAIVKQLVETHGSAVSVISAPGHGATFRCTLPISPHAA